MVEWRDYARDAKAENCPLLATQISMFNDLSKWIMGMVLNKENAEFRAKAMKKFIRVGRVGNIFH